MSSPYLPRRLPLADEFWFLTHRPYGPGTLLADDILGVGLAGAVIGELALAGYVWLQEGRVMPAERPQVEQYRPPLADGGRHSMDGSWRSAPIPSRAVDPLHEVVMGEITARGALYPVQDWIAFLAGDADRRVAERLAVAGHVVSAGKGLLRRRQSWEPVDASTASSPAVTLRYHARAPLATREGVDSQTALLAGLALATKLVRDIDMDETIELERALLGMVESLPDSMLSMLSAVQHAVTGLTRQVRR
ncbi:GPP34 family phosphoprotein [Dactylosporangium sp. NPDC000521]|uniref:GPP34 family phosphoprotein n=1 Tax=Dactylosporangium sp. NPDC000521 TaxID=3363975 RepID=UPI003698A269